MDRQTILTIEDDAAIRRGIVDALDFAGYGVLQAATGPTGRELALTQPCDLLLLDLVLPGGDGFDILRAVRQHKATLPVIILTARGDESDRVAGLRLGADDYVVKPFSVRELLARVEAVLRRSPERPRQIEVIEMAHATADLARCEVRFVDGSRHELSDKETEILRYLAANPARAISRDELLQRVWGLNPRGITTRTVDMHVARLREKLQDDPDSPRFIITVRGKGYMFGWQSNESCRS